MNVRFYLTNPEFTEEEFEKSELVKRCISLGFTSKRVQKKTLFSKMRDGVLEQRVVTRYEFASFEDKYACDALIGALRRLDYECVISFKDDMCFVEIYNDYRE